MAGILENRLIRIIRHKYMSRLFFAVLLFVIAICTGMIGFMIIEGYTANEAFYMTIITISTVGYKEIRPLSEEGRLFTAILIIFRIGRTPRIWRD